VNLNHKQKVTDFSVSFSNSVVSNRGASEITDQRNVSARFNVNSTVMIKIKERAA
jgi:hypothetical protein